MIALLALLHLAASLSLSRAFALLSHSYSHFQPAFAAQKSTPQCALARNQNAPQAATAAIQSTLSDCTYECELWQKGIPYVIGVDEAGRGPLAGPVVAAAVCMVPASVDCYTGSLKHLIEGVDDSKALSERARERIYEQLVTSTSEYKDCYYFFDTAVADHAEIDRENILQATMIAMRKATESVLTQLSAHYKQQGSINTNAGIITGDSNSSNAMALIDGNKSPRELLCPSTAVVKGDSKVYSIALASVLAKVTRDRMMLQLHEQYPLYGFDKHKGYPTKAHFAAIAQLGPCPAHRLSFKPFKKGI